MIIVLELKEPRCYFSLRNFEKLVNKLRNSKKFCACGELNIFLEFELFNFFKELTLHQTLHNFLNKKANLWECMLKCKVSSAALEIFQFLKIYQLVKLAWKRFLHFIFFCRAQEKYIFNKETSNKISTWLHFRKSGDKKWFYKYMNKR